MNHNIILAVDAIVNYVLGIILLLFPFNISAILGLPATNQYFYPVIFGAVLFGIGIALTIEYFKNGKSISGLGTGGAIAINLCGAIALALWLLFANLDIPLRGVIILSFIAFIVLLIGIIELIYIFKTGKI